MCGIFGISFNKKYNQSDFSILKKDINILAQKSQQRGSDTFGILIKDKNNNSIYKINEDPSDAINRKDYNLFLKEKININSGVLNIMGQTRLVTNGSKFSDQNNQPLITDKIIGVHNGIFVNFELDKNAEKTKNYESISIKSDSLKFFELLSNIPQDQDFINHYKNILSKMRGNYTIAFVLKDYNEIILSSNCGSLFYYYDKDKKLISYASEKNILYEYLAESKFVQSLGIRIKKDQIKQCLNETIIFNNANNSIKIFKLNDQLDQIKLDETNKNINTITSNNYDENLRRHSKLKRCTKCILLETYPYIKFDNNGVCNFCLEYDKQEFFGEEKLFKILEKYRSKNGEPDCIVGLSGGRDSSYGLHLIKTKYKMNPIAYTFDWGLTTDISRINASKLCGKLGVEHIIRSAKIDERRSHVRENLFAWLKRPHLGMIPMLQAGDKGFYEYGRRLSKELNLKLVIHSTGYQLEQREFFLGFLGVNERLKNNPTLYDYSFINKINMLLKYGLQYFLNPSYFNSSFFATAQAFIHSFVLKERFLHLFRYEKWEEQKIINTLEKEYEWESDISYGKNQWRMGDGQTAFNNFVYYTVAGFSEYDNFRANQIREGIITREEGLKLAEEDNKIKYDTLKIYSEIIGFNLDSVLSKVSCIPKLY